MKEEANQHEAAEKQKGLGESKSKIYKKDNNTRINQNKQQQKGECCNRAAHIGHPELDRIIFTQFNSDQPLFALIPAGRRPAPTSARCFRLWQNQQRVGAPLPPKWVL